MDGHRGFLNKTRMGDPERLTPSKMTEDLGTRSGHTVLGGSGGLSKWVNNGDN